VAAGLQRCRRGGAHPAATHHNKVHGSDCSTNPAPWLGIETFDQAAEGPPAAPLGASLAIGLVMAASG